MSEMIERVAEAMWTARQEVHEHYPDDGPWASQVEMVKDWLRAEARAAIEAMREPTPEMFERFATYHEELVACEGYRALIDGALK